MLIFFRPRQVCTLACAFLLLACEEDVKDPSFGSGSATQTGTGYDTGLDTGLGDTGVSASGGDSTTAGGTCNNGVIDSNESCDGTNLAGATCETLGEGGGTLACDPMMCTYDTSMCTGSGTAGTTG